jgi:dihydroorotate dehydrogenase (fumarate)
VTGGVETWQDGVKAILAGAHAVQMVSALLRGGAGRLGATRAHLVEWMERHQIASMDEMRGRVSLRTTVDAGNFERANYIRSLHSWTRGTA